MWRLPWLHAWWRQISGPPKTDPWNDDPKIRAERRGQHARIGRVTGASAREQIRHLMDDRRYLDMGK